MGKNDFLKRLSGLSGSRYVYSREIDGKFPDKNAGFKRIDYLAKELQDSQKRGSDIKYFLEKYRKYEKDSRKVRIWARNSVESINY